MEKMIFGRYPQGKNGEVEPLVWLVVAETEEGTLLLAEKVIDCQPFHNADGAWSWETCSIRFWLNGEFMQSAFSAKEQTRVQSVALMEARWGSLANPIDLSEMFAYPTEYAKKRGVFVYDGNRTSWWWVNGYGHARTHVQFVNYDGYVFGPGRKATANNYGVRPTIFLKK